MKRRKKRMLLTLIIAVLVLVLIIMIVGIAFEEKRNKDNQTGEELEISDANAPDSEGEEINLTEDEQQAESAEEDVNEIQTEEKAPEYVGEEENVEQKDSTQSEEQKVIDIVKKQWGDDNSVTFTIEKKNGTKYRVAVRDASTTVLQWYEVDTETWEASEY